jgi:thiol-disulfide isomerase/thioredoxin
MMELTEETVNAFIESAPIVVIKGWMKNCPHCVNYDPVFADVATKSQGITFGTIELPPDKSSQFRLKYMKSKPGERSGAPCTFLFEKGEFKRKWHGSMNKEQLVAWINDGTEPELPRKTPQQMTLLELKAMVYDAMAEVEFRQRMVQELNQEISRRQQGAQHAN